MKLLMENWRVYQGNHNFDILCENYDRGLIDEAKLLSTWENNIVEELTPILNEITLLEEGIIDIGIEKLASLGAKAKQAWANKISAIYEKVKVFMIKILNQALELLARAIKFIDKAQFEASIRSYLGIINALGKLLNGAIKVAPYIGKFAIVAIGIMILTVALSGTAHAATSGLQDPELLSVAAELLTQAWENAGGIETTELDAWKRVVDYEILNGEVVNNVQTIVDLSGEGSQNDTVEAISLITGKLRGNYDAMGDDYLEFLFDNSPSLEKVETIVNNALQDAETLKQTDPELFNQMSETGKKIKVIWSGHIESMYDRLSQRAVGAPGGDTERTAISDFSQSVGLEYPVRK